MPETNFLKEKQRVLQVSELAHAINQLLEGSVPLLWVRGEISNLVKASSGHWYFALKDEQAQVRCVMFRQKNILQDHVLENGVQVEVLASASLYEARGDFQLIVEQLRPAGQGALYEQFARLKQKLAQEGLFASERKRPLPRFPKRIGIITSIQAAALRDVLSILKQRLPSVPVVLYPAPVQGAGSAEKVVQAIEAANNRAECSVLILCRGGGSIEDLWTFNEEIVARAIAASRIPIVSGIGHETDFTIADFVADERAPTPTAAAQRVVPDRSSLVQGLRDMSQHLTRPMRNRLRNAMQTLDFLQCRIVHPAEQMRRKLLQLDQLQQRMQRNFEHVLQEKHWRQESLMRRLSIAGHDFQRLSDRQNHLQERLFQGMRINQRQRMEKLAAHMQHLDLLNPERVLARGYSLVQDEKGHLVSEAHSLELDADIKIVFGKGWARARVQEKGD